MKKKKIEIVSKPHNFYFNCQLLSTASSTSPTRDPSDAQFDGPGSLGEVPIISF